MLQLCDADRRHRGVLFVTCAMFAGEYSDGFWSLLLKNGTGRLCMAVEPFSYRILFYRMTTYTLSGI